MENEDMRYAVRDSKGRFIKSNHDLKGFIKQRTEPKFAWFEFLVGAFFGGLLFVIVEIIVHY